MSLELIVSKLLSLALGVVGLSVLVGIHELGHFLFCKLFNVHTPSFSIGFGPHIFTKKIGETEFSLSAVPLGGYVEIAGLQEVGQGEQTEAFRSDQRAFSSKPYFQKLLILLGGIGFNLAFAYVSLMLLFTFWGMPATPLLAPHTTTNTVATILPHSPAEKADIQIGDTIQAINHQALVPQQGMDLFFEHLRTHADQQISLTIERNGIIQEKTVQLESLKNGAILGLGFSSQATPPIPVTSAVVEGITQVHRWILATFASLANMIQYRTMRGLGGPISVVHGIALNVHQGISWFVVMLAFISVGLACLNILPLPIFDGGQVLFYTIEAVTGWSLDRIRIYIHYASWIAVLGLMLYLSWYDLVRIITGN